MKMRKIVVVIGVLSVVLMISNVVQAEPKMGSHHGEHERCAGMEKMKTHWESMEKLAQELKTHTGTMKGITNQDKLIPELLKHQEMVDTFIGKMIELQQIRRDMMKEHHQKTEEKQKEE